MNSGDLVFVRSSDIIGRGIRLAQWLHKPWRQGSRWNHVAILDRKETLGDLTDWTVIQAEAKGVTSDGWLSQFAEYEVMLLPPQFTRSKVLTFARAQVGRPYGFLTIASILFTLFTPKFIDVLVPGTWICSALGAEAWRFAGWYHSWGDERQVSPAELWMALNGNYPLTV